MNDASTRPSTLPSRRTPSGALGLRLALFGRASAIAFTSLVGVVLFSLWVTFVALSPLTVVAWLVLPITAMVRAFANANRRAAGHVLGEQIAPPYRSTDGAKWLNRIWTIVRDPASWRDALWMFVHAITGCFLSMLQVFLLIGSVFYLIFPFLYWVTPQNVFGQPFGVWTLHSVGESFVMTPLALVSFAIWWTTAIPLTRAEASITRSLLR